MKIVFINKSLTVIGSRLHLINVVFALTLQTTKEPLTIPNLKQRGTKNRFNRANITHYFRSEFQLSFLFQ